MRLSTLVVLSSTAFTWTTLAYPAPAPSHFDDVLSRRRDVEDLHARRDVLPRSVDEDFNDSLLRRDNVRLEERGKGDNKSGGKGNNTLNTAGKAGGKNGKQLPQNSTRPPMGQKKGKVGPVDDPMQQGPAGNSDPNSADDVSPRSVDEDFNDSLLRRDNVRLEVRGGGDNNTPNTGKVRGKNGKQLPQNSTQPPMGQAGGGQGDLVNSPMQQGLAGNSDLNSADPLSETGGNY